MSEYIVIIGGMVILKKTEDGIKPYFQAGGVRYDTGSKKILVALQEVYADHAEEIATAMEPLNDDLLNMGRMIVLAKDPSVQQEKEALDAVLDENPTDIRGRRNERKKGNKKR